MLKYYVSKSPPTNNIYKLLSFLNPTKLSSILLLNANIHQPFFSARPSFLLTFKHRFLHYVHKLTLISPMPIRVIKFFQFSLQRQTPLCSEPLPSNPHFYSLPLPNPVSYLLVMHFQKIARLKTVAKGSKFLLQVLAA